MLAAVERAAADETANGGMTRSVGLAIVRAIAAFGRGRWDETISLLLPVRYRANAFGGSHAQRDIVHRTPRGGCSRAPAAGDGARRRTDGSKPHCPFAWRERRRPRACRRRRDGLMWRQPRRAERAVRYRRGGNGRLVWQVPWQVSATGADAGAPTQVPFSRQHLAGFAQVPFAVGADADPGAAAAVRFGGPGTE